MPAVSSSKTERLAAPYEYKRVYTKADLFRGRSFWVYRLPRPAGNTRLGISISSRVIKKATQRNRLKRVIREWARQHPLGSCDIVVVVKKAILPSRSGSIAIRKELSEFFN
jgi:ribonuclease P protein component